MWNMHFTKMVVGVGFRHGQRKGCGPRSFVVLASSREVEDPAVLSQHKGIRQGDATRMSPNGPGVG